MSDFRPIDQWPLLLCGPMLRRVDKYGVSVFVATKMPCTVQVTVTRGGAVVADSAELPTLPIGERLHVLVAEATPVGQALTDGQTYSYDVQFSEGNRVHTLRSLNLLTGSMPLGYQEGALPTFVLPPNDLAGLRLAHASCRKPHGGGGDALWTLDSLIPTPRRPQQLFLTGDQIYADDVGVCLLHSLIGVGNHLIGGAHRETFSPGDLPLGHELLSPGENRSKWLKVHATKWDEKGNKLGGLTSEAADNHLMFFAEFCAMYLMVWSDELWARDDNHPDRLLVAALTEENVGKWYPSTKPDPLFGRREHPNDLDWIHRRLTDFTRTIRKVRRILANTPTMTMFDDHEITDDWNLDQEWAADSIRMPVVRRIIRNGLLAYAVFQAWGNTPSRFTGPGRGSELLVKLVGTTAAPSPLVANPEGANTLLDLVAGHADATERVQWDWVLDGPHHRVIGLDTRTHRELDAKPTQPGLLTDVEMERQLTAHKTTERLCFVLSPAPVIGHPFVEEFVQSLLAYIQGTRAADSEAWLVNGDTYLNMLACLAEFGRVVLLSGDVHYAYSNQCAYFSGTRTPARIIQLTSSSAKNAELKTRVLEIDWFAPPPRGLLGFKAITEADRLRLADALRRLPAPLLGEGERRLADILSKATAARLSTPFPGVIASGPWAQPDLAAFLRLLQGLNRPGDCQISIKFLSDTRTGATRLDEYATDPWAYLLGNALASRRWVAEASHTAVGECNVGEISLRKEGQNDVLAHRLLSPNPFVPLSVVASCLHETPLTTPTPEERPQVYP